MIRKRLIVDVFGRGKVDQSKATEVSPASSGLRWYIIAAPTVRMWVGWSHTWSKEWEDGWTQGTSVGLGG
jgi:hypothetical protein